MQINIFNDINIIHDLAFNIYKYFLTIFLHKLKIIRNKETIRRFKFYDLYTYSAKSLNVSKKVMLLLNMKKTLNNFWAWIRTHTIFYMRKPARGLKHYFMRIRDILLGFYDVGMRHYYKDHYKATSLVAKNTTKQIGRNDARLRRKFAWLSQQRTYKEEHDLRFKPKHYIQQTKEYFHLFAKKEKLAEKLSKSKFRANVAKYALKYSRMFQSLIPDHILTWEYQFKSRFAQLLYNTFENLRAKIRDLKYQHTKGTLSILSLEDTSQFNKKKNDNKKSRNLLINHYLSIRTLKYALKTIKKRYVPYNQYKKIERKYRRVRYKIFRKIRWILVRQESAKLQMQSMLYTMTKAHKLCNEDAIVKKNYRVILQKKKREYFYSTHKTLAQIFQYNLSEVITVFTKFIQRQYARVAPPILTKFQTIKNNIKTNFLELKRVYDTHKWSLKQIITRNQFNARTRIVLWGSAGKLGFHSNKRTTPYAAEVLGKYFSRLLNRRRINFINIQFTEMPRKKEREFLKGFSKLKINFLRMYYKRKIMFGTIRKPKQRRV